MGPSVSIEYLQTFRESVDEDSLPAGWVPRITVCNARIVVSTHPGACLSTQRFDYIIVGGGTAGCVLANRLSARLDTNVLLLEAGPRRGNWWVEMPLAFVLILQSKRYNWAYRTHAEPALNQRRLYCPSGRVLGGSSAINGMVHARGHPSDYDRWRALGASGWSARDVLAYFKKS